ncbi:RHS repeat-associated core domain-containing protein [Citrobacter freundii]|nr:RHS repeat-associated core domain-containing protein [Citrobacter freundii]
MKMKPKSITLNRLANFILSGAENMRDTAIGYTGQRRSGVSGHYLLGNGYRGFNPVLKRFAGQDSLSPFGAGGEHGFAYCGGDPVNQSDPSGHGPLLDFIISLTLDGVRLARREAVVAEGAEVVAAQHRLAVAGSAANLTTELSVDGSITVTRAGGLEEALTVNKANGLTLQFQQDFLRKAGVQVLNVRRDGFLDVRIAERNASGLAARGKFTIQLQVNRNIRNARFNGLRYREFDPKLNKALGEYTNLSASDFDDFISEQEDALQRRFYTLRQPAPAYGELTPSYDVASLPSFEEAISNIRRGH